jgi:hypothetical protein
MSSSLKTHTHTHTQVDVARLLLLIVGEAARDPAAWANSGECLRDARVHVTVNAHKLISGSVH